MTDLLFVYGTLMRGRKIEKAHAMAKWLAQHSELIGEATFNGRLYRISTYPGIVASNNPADLVHGEVVRLRNGVEVLSELDRYEACGEGFSEPTEYVRLLGRVSLAAGGEIEAWVYLYNWPVSEAARIVSGRFLAT